MVRVDALLDLGDALHRREPGLHDDRIHDEPLRIGSTTSGSFVKGGALERMDWGARFRLRGVEIGKIQDV